MSTMKLAEALSKAQGEIEGAKKDSTNPFFRSKYADLASVWAAIREPLTKNGLSVVQPITSTRDEVTVKTLILHASGEMLDAGALTVPVPHFIDKNGKDLGATPQTFGSAITYARRYSLMAAFGVAPEDDDGEAASAPIRDGQSRYQPRDAAPTPRQAQVQTAPATPPPDPKAKAAATAFTAKKFAIWTDAKAAGISKTDFGQWVANVLGSPKQSKDWNEADVAALETALIPPEPQPPPQTDSDVPF